MTMLAKRTGQFSETEIDDEIVVMHLVTGEFFSLAGTAATTWRLIDGTRDRASIVEVLAAEFGGDLREIARDVDEFLMELKKLDLIEDA